LKDSENLEPNKKRDVGNERGYKRKQKGKDKRSV
jgi:hypothetical protein